MTAMVTAPVTPINKCLIDPSSGPYRQRCILHPLWARSRTEMEKPDRAELCGSARGVDVDRPFGAAVAGIIDPTAAGALPPPQQGRIAVQFAKHGASLGMRRRGVIEPDPAHADAVDCDEPSVEIEGEPVAEFALQGEQLGWPRRLRTGTVPHIKPVDHRNRLPRLLHELQQCRIDL